MTEPLDTPAPRPSLCRGRRVYGQDYRYDCDWIMCPILDGDDDFRRLALRGRIIAPHQAL